MLRHLAVLVLFFLCGSLIQAAPLEVEPAQAASVDVQKSSDSADDLDSAASSWGGYGIRGWFGPSYYGGSWGGRGHHGQGWGNSWGSGWGNRGQHYGGGWNGWGTGYGGGWGGRNYGYGSGWNRGGYW